MIYDKYTEQRNAIIHPDIAISVLDRLPLLREYVKLTSAVDKAFELALYEHYGVEYNEKRSLVFKYANDRATGDIYSETEWIFKELVELIK